MEIFNACLSKHFSKHFVKYLFIECSSGQDEALLSLAVLSLVYDKSG